MEGQGGLLPVASDACSSFSSVLEEHPSSLPAAAASVSPLRRVCPQLEEAEGLHVSVEEKHTL